MIKHLILWKLKDDIPAADKEDIKAAIKAGLEGLQGKIPGLLAIHVQTVCLPSSNADLLLDSDFADQDSLRAYAVHPEHLAVANTKVRPFTQTRLCLDFSQD